MSWKKSLPFFAWQSIRYAKNWKHFVQIWSYYRVWKNSLLVGRSSIKDEKPWVNFIAQEYLEKLLRPEFKVFEYGGGGSTLFFCKSVTEVATVEHDPEWYQLLKKVMQEKGYENWQGFQIGPEPAKDDRPFSPSNPNYFQSNSKIFRKEQFERYAQSIHRYPQSYFDLVLVDGRARPSCIVQSIPFIKAGGILFVDNTERNYYLSEIINDIKANFNKEFEFFAPIPYNPDFTQSTIFRKK